MKYVYVLIILLMPFSLFAKIKGDKEYNLTKRKTGDEVHFINDSIGHLVRFIKTEGDSVICSELTDSNKIFSINANIIDYIFLPNGSDGKNEIIYPLDSGCYSFFNGTLFKTPQGIFCPSSKVWFKYNGKDFALKTRNTDSGEFVYKEYLGKVKPKFDFSIITKKLHYFFEKSITISLIISIIIIILLTLLGTFLFKLKKENFGIYFIAAIGVALALIPFTYNFINDIKNEGLTIEVNCNVDPFQKVILKRLSVPILVNGYYLGIIKTDTTRKLYYYTSENIIIDSIKKNDGLRTINMNYALLLTIKCKIVNNNKIEKNISIDKIEDSYEYSIADNNEVIDMESWDFNHKIYNQIDSIIPFPDNIKFGEEKIYKLEINWPINEYTAMFIKDEIEKNPKINLYDLIDVCKQNKIEICKTIDNEDFQESILSIFTSDSKVTKGYIKLDLDNIKKF